MKQNKTECTVCDTLSSGMQLSSWQWCRDSDAELERLVPTRRWTSASCTDTSTPTYTTSTYTITHHHIIIITKDNNMLQ